MVINLHWSYLLLVYIEDVSSELSTFFERRERPNMAYVPGSMRSDGNNRPRYSISIHSIHVGKKGSCPRLKISERENLTARTAVPPMPHHGILDNNKASCYFVTVERS